ncbi:MAG: TetR/AcrR family bet gene transcriptional repressor [Paracoccaceae bacterium]|jgi:TetR/AcrR family transcriptional repressor of bet genes
MPKVGMEPIRRAALVNAAIAEIGAHGTLDVTVSQIAKRAGVSSGLAHHYFGSKEQIFLATMRHIMTMFGNRVRAELIEATTPRERLNGIIAASFDPEEFAPEVISSWLIFYVQAQNSEGAMLLLNIYIKRFHSNLVYNLKQLTNDANAQLIAAGVAALIDGLYIRQALNKNPLDRFQTMGLVWDYLDLKLGQATT